MFSNVFKVTQPKMLILKSMSLVNNQQAFISLETNTSAYIMKAVDIVSECNGKDNIETNHYAEKEHR